MDTKKVLKPAGWLAAAVLLAMALFAPVASASDSNHGDGWHFDGHWHWECDRGTPKAGPTTLDKGTSVNGWDWKRDWSKECFKPSQDPCASSKPDAPTSVTHRDVACPTPTPSPSASVSVPPVIATPVPTPTLAPSATPNLPSGNVGGETGNPNITPPPTDGISAVAAVARSWSTLLLAIVGLLASVLILTPMAIRRRR